MKLEPLFEMVHKYVEMHPVKMQAQFGQESVSWLFREGTLVGERVRGTHKAMNKSVLRADNVVTPDIRGILFTDDGESIYYEVRGYGIEVDGLRHFRGSMYFMTGSEKYAWLNTVLGVMEGRYQRDDANFLIGTFKVYECIIEADKVETRSTYHEGVAAPSR